MNTIKGKITLSSKRPAVKLTVKLYQVTFKGETLIGTSITNNYGKFQFEHSETVKNIIIHLYNPRSKTPVLSSETYLKTVGDLTVQLELEDRLYKGSSVFKKIQESIAPHIGKLSITQLNTDRMNLLASEAEIPIQELLNYQKAFLQQQKKGHFAPEVFFALLETRTATEGNAFYALTLDQLKHAFAQSVAEHIITNTRILSATASRQFTLHQSLSINHFLKDIEFTQGVPIKTLWRLARPTTAQLKILGGLLKTHTGNAAAFWTAVQANKPVNLLYSKLFFLTGLSNITLGNFQLTGQIYQNKAINNLEALAGFTIERWMQLIGRTRIPKQITGKPTERKRAYAQLMKRMADFAFPNRNIFISSMVDTKLTTILRSDYSRFFQTNPNFNIVTSQLNTYLQDNPTALKKVKQKDQFVLHLSETIRLFGITPAVDQYPYIDILRSMEISTAGQITKKGQQGFEVSFMQVGGNKIAAKWIYGQVQQTVATLSNIVMKYQYDMLNLPNVMNMGIESDPNWKNLFGNEDYCACSHCKSVYGPAAYLTDTLNFLENRKLTNGTNAYQWLRSRRPDIEHILLNCENAHTPMPYIDLVNEVLEAAVVRTNQTTGRSTTRTAAIHLQTTLTAEELAASPEHIKTTAYEILKTATFPWTLPFDLHNQLGRTYLEHLGVKHHKLVSLFPYNESPKAPTRGRRTTSSIDSDSKRKTKSILGLIETDWSILTLNLIQYKLREKELWNTTSRRFPVKIERLIQITQLELDEFKEVIESRFVNPTNDLTINYIDPCSLSGATLVNFKPLNRLRMIQLIRLKHQLKVDARTMDQLLFGLDITEINESNLEQIAQLQLWKDTYAISYKQVITWLGTIPTRRPQDKENHKELYESLFLTKIEGHEANVREKFVLNDLGTELKQTNIDLLVDKSVCSYIQGALNIQSEDLVALIEWLPFSIVESTTRRTSRITDYESIKVLSIENLSAIYGTVSLAKKLQIEIPTLIQLYKILNVEVRNIDGIKSLIELIYTFKQSSLSISKALFLFGENAEIYALNTQRKTEIIQEIREGVWKYHNQGIDVDQENVLSPVTSADFVFEKLSAAFSINRDIITGLLKQQNNDGFYLDEDYPAIFEKSFQNTSEVGTIDLVDYPELNHLLDKLNEISILVNVLNFDSEDYNRLLTKTGKENWLDFNLLFTTALKHENLTRLLNINELISLGNTTESSVFDLLKPQENWALIGEYVRTKNAITISKALGLNLTDFRNPDAYMKLIKAVTLESHLGITIADHSNGAGQFNWAKSTLRIEEVRAVVQTAKSKHGEEQWFKVTKQLRDIIREEQRDALLRYVLSLNMAVNNMVIDTPEELYAHFLIDVEMSACTITSRIKLALSSTQLFVQRCLMNLEPNVKLSGISEEEQAEWQEWAWRKNYRVWEANRKVFLYPENWLEPEWREDKTPFFKELESQLQQNELNTENAEKAYLSYLHKLEEVSDMKILALCSDNQGPTIFDNGYYIFGRTHGNPKTLYFRKFNQKPQSFTPWEKVEVDFEGNHLIPHVHNGRLYLFWPVFLEQSRKGIKKGNGYEEPIKFWRINIASSIYKNEVWEPKMTSSSFMDNIFINNTDYSIIDSPISSFLFVKNIVENSIRLSVVISGRPIHYDEFGQATPSSNQDESVQNAIGEFKINLNNFSLTTAKEIDYKRYEFENRFNLKRSNQKFEGLETNKEEILISNLRIKSNQIETVEITPTWARWIQESGDFTNYFLRANIYNRPFVFSDDKNSYIVFPKYGQYHFLEFSHPLISNLISSINLNRSKNLLDSNFLAIQKIERDDFSSYYEFNPSENLGNTPKIQLDFSLEGANSQYNWELFFHIPVHIANKLHQDQKFEEAQKWFHYIFNPTSSSDEDAPAKFWLFKPFKEFVCSAENGTPCSIQELMILLNKESEIDGTQQFKEAVQIWEQNPFSPHTIARTRIVAYMKWVVMRYIDNLIEWADQLFRRDSIESLNEATQLYMLAWNILGGEANKMDEADQIDLTYTELKAKGFDAFSNVLIKLEDGISRTSAAFENKAALNLPVPEEINTYFETTTKPAITNEGQNEIITSSSLYFCIPPNQKLLGYWGLVKDRFFKLRNCLNIEGVYRQIPLYEPPIDPALLIQAKASGLSIADALSAKYQTPSHYRYLALNQKAIDYANDVRSFGGALLAAMEKRDAERIGLLRSQHEVQLLEATKFIRKEQINELSESNKALIHSQASIENRKSYYDNKEFMNPLEIVQMDTSFQSQVLKTISHVTSAGAAVQQVIPDIEFGYSGWGGHSTVTVGGSKTSSAIDHAAKAMSGISGVLDLISSMTGQMASYQRREEDWKFQVSNAEIELKQIEKQILASEIRMSIAKQELRNHELQIENSKEHRELVKAKFTNAQLYDWMVEQLKTLYFQSYQMAFDMAKKAEHALKHELGKEISETFIQFGYWDNLKEGLLAGEKLHHDLKRMEMIYMQRNKRKQEISQTFSLALLNPEELAYLRANGTANISIPEIFFDLAHPKLKNRKVKSISITVPSVTGPYTGVHGTLSGNGEQISTSSAQNDAGLFQFNFNDERYLPFEKIALDNTAEDPDFIEPKWTFELNTQFRSFNYETISDVLLHINYTADYDPSKTVDIANKFDGKTLSRYFNIKNEFAQEWFEAKQKTDGKLSIFISNKMLPYLAQNKGFIVEPKSIQYISLADVTDKDTSLWKMGEINLENGGWKIDLEDINFEQELLLIFNYEIKKSLNVMP